MHFDQAKKALKKYFGYDTFHPTQEKAIKAVLAGKDAFVLMPTGGGKSICYQIPALVLEGTTIVVSPLIALMKDQVDGLNANGIAAEFLNSSLDSHQQNEILERLLQGEISIIYVSAERLVSPPFFKVLQQIKLNLFAIDEAHCISSWGHDFRPDYTKLSELRVQFPAVPIIALTATADKITKDDILSQLGLDNPIELVDSFDRPNISLTVLPGQKRAQQIKNFLSDKSHQSGIIYCLTRKQTEKLAKSLQQQGFSAASYHAGMSKKDRSRVQKSFVRDTTQVICATIAFGMGIDKSNVRWVIHYNIPKNIEGYYQEIGRAGRDSAPAAALLFYTYADIKMIEKFFIDKSQGSLQLAKLKRIKEYAEGVICRRQILLRYFDEVYEQECGNCDVCKNPYKTLDGTRITREMLSVVKKSSFTTETLVSHLLNLSSKVSFAQWHFYLAQLKNLGLIKVNFDNDQHLSLTKKGEEFLLKNKKIRLVTLDTFIERQQQISKVSKSHKKESKNYFKNSLFEKLRELRSQLARENSCPAYIIFNDKTLLEMANEKPKNKQEMLNISGVGEVKWEKYGHEFLEVVGEK